jgi:hypothetical protein
MFCASAILGLGRGDRLPLHVLHPGAIIAACARSNGGRHLAKRLVARELEIRWNTALERVAHLEDRIVRHDAAAALRPKVDRAALIALARDLPATWNAPGKDARTR